MSVPPPHKPQAHPDESTVQAEEGFVIDTVGWRGFPCPECDQPFLSQKALNGHRTKTHQYTASERQYIIGTTCIKCNRTLCNIDSAIRHVRLNEHRLECLGSRGRTSGVGHLS